MYATFRRSLTYTAAVAVLIVCRAAAADSPRLDLSASEFSSPTQVFWSATGDLIFAWESGPRRWASIEQATGQVLSRGDATPGVITHVAIFARAADGKTVALAAPWQSRLLVGAPAGEDLAHEAFSRTRTVELAAWPQSLAFGPDSRRLFVACDSPGLGDKLLGIVDLGAGDNVTYRPVPGGNLRGVAVDPEGKFVLAVHVLSKSHLPSTQIDQGWVFTNAVSYLALDESNLVVTLPLDTRTRGFANPEGVVIAPDRSRAYIAHAGADVVSVIDLAALQEVVREVAANCANGSGRPSGADCHAILADDLRMTPRYIAARLAVGASPCGMALAPDGVLLAVANRLDDSISIIDTRQDRVVRTIRMSTKPPDLARQGEILFHAGRLSFSGQFSCASCHPRGHTDGLNWDLPADGFANFQNTKSLLNVAGTGPYGWRGESRTLRRRFTGTLRGLFQHEVSGPEAAALEAYLAVLGQQSEDLPSASSSTPAANRGEVLFRGAAGCSECHGGPRFTDGLTHDLGLAPGEEGFDTPSLLRVAAAPPFLHDGRAATLLDVLTRHNPARLHGNAHALTPAELADLVEYLKTL